MPDSKPIHPLIVRTTHWVNALAILIMVTSGWRIYNASPIFPFSFPDSLTLGGWLAGALLWHFAAMWLFVANLALYLAYGIASGRFRMRLWPVTPRAVVRDTSDFLHGKLSHGDLAIYNAVQKIAYIGVILSMLLLILSGISIWKPVQFQTLVALFGGYDIARIVHFAAMSAVMLFVLVHVVMALLVPKSLLAMVRGR
jgi:thiosulfate reductase cytochrome b subunit